MPQKALTRLFQFPPEFLITGTDTDVGKTIIASILTLGLKAKYWKPIQSGLEPMTDSERVKALTQLPQEHFHPETYKLIQPLAPLHAAKYENIDIDIKAFVKPHFRPLAHLIIEGAGGIMVPLNERKECLIDLAAVWQIPTLIVARSTLGTLNHTLLTIAALQNRQIPLLGVVLNGQKNPLNRQTIESFGGAVLAEIEPLKEFSPSHLQEVFNQSFARVLD